MQLKGRLMFFTTYLPEDGNLDALSTETPHPKKKGLQSGLECRLVVGSVL
jgi:hypothetical protein